MSRQAPTPTEQRVLDLWFAGKTSHEIQDITDVGNSNVRGIIMRARARRDPRAVGKQVRTGRPVLKVCLRLPPHVAQATIDEAERRGTSPDVLIAKMIELAATDNLYMAVLDDWGLPA